MSTPNPVPFPPITKGFNWTPSTTGDGGAAMPAGEAPSGSTVGIRPDGDSTHAAGNYKYLVAVSGATSQLLITDPQWLAAKIPPGNYWADVDQTDLLGTQSLTSGWSGKEVAFSIPAPIVRPAPPSGFGVA